MRDESFDLNKQDEESRAMNYWWRLASKFDECIKFNFEKIQNLSKLTPILKVLREMERLYLMSIESFDELRQKLMSYKVGDFWVPIGGINKEDLDIPPVNTILLVGFHNAGKSSLVNLMYSVLGQSGLIPFAQTSSGYFSVLFYLSSDYQMFIFTSLMYVSCLRFTLLITRTLRLKFESEGAYLLNNSLLSILSKFAKVYD